MDRVLTKYSVQKQMGLFKRVPGSTVFGDVNYLSIQPNVVRSKATGTVGVMGILRMVDGMLNTPVYDVKGDTSWATKQEVRWDRVII